MPIQIATFVMLISSRSEAKSDHGRLVSKKTLGALAILGNPPG